jgi:hypothetical protein
MLQNSLELGYPVGEIFIALARFLVAALKVTLSSILFSHTALIFRSLLRLLSIACLALALNLGLSLLSSCLPCDTIDDALIVPLGHRMASFHPLNSQHGPISILCVRQQ